MEFKYQYIVGLQVETFFPPYYANYLSARGAAEGLKLAITSWLNEWEKWRIINYNNRDSQDLLHFSDIVAFENVQFSVYPSGDHDNNFVYTQPLMQPDQRWRLLNADDPGSTSVITSANKILLQNVTNSKYLTMMDASENNIFFHLERQYAANVRFINLTVF